MVTIPVSMYQTVVTNLTNLQGDTNIPITMSAIAGTNQLENVTDDDNGEVKTVLNGQNAIRITTTSEDNSQKEEEEERMKKLK